MTLLRLKGLFLICSCSAHTSDPSTVLTNAAFEEVSNYLKSLLPTPVHSKKSALYKKRGRFAPRATPRASSFGSRNIALEAGNIGARVQRTLETLRSKIPEAVESIEKDIAVSNRDKVILALANFLGSKSQKQSTKNKKDAIVICFQCGSVS